MDHMSGAHQAQAFVTARGPRFAIVGALRRTEYVGHYTDTAEAADRIGQKMLDDHFHQVKITPPVGSIDLTTLARTRDAAKAAFDEATSVLRAAVHRAAAEGRSEYEIADKSHIDRMTVRSWLGKQ